MGEQKKEYYLKSGRLDLSTLDLLEERAVEVHAMEAKDEDVRIPLPGIYKDTHIDEILKEMGDYFSNA